MKMNALSYMIKYFFKKNNFMVPFYGWGSTTSRLEPLLVNFQTVIFKKPTFDKI